MKSRTVLAVVAACAIVGIATGVGARELSPDDKKAPTGQETITPPSNDPKDWVIEPGLVGRVSAGMTKDEAIATGLFDADIPPAVDGCPVIPLAFKDKYASVVDVLTLGNGQIAAIGVRAAGPKTDDGLGVGSTYAEVRAALPDADAEEAGFDQAGMFEFDPEAGGWIGYLFDSSADKIKADTKVLMVEVTRGAKPDLMRSGC